MNRDTASRWTPPAATSPWPALPFFRLPHHPQCLAPHLPHRLAFEQRLCDPVRIKPARGPVLRVHDALLHLPGGGQQATPGTTPTASPWMQTGLLVATGRTQSAGFPMTTGGEPSIFNRAPYLKAGTSGDEPYLVKIDPALNGEHPWSTPPSWEADRQTYQKTSGAACAPAWASIRWERSM